MSWRRCLCVIIMVVVGSFGLVGCSTPQNGGQDGAPSEGALNSPKDLFEPLRVPYRDAFTATFQEDKFKAKGSVQQMLEILETLKVSAPSSWPAPYRDQPELTQEAIELFLNQTKVAGALNITGDYKQAHQTLEELGEFLRKVRGGLGVEHPTDQLMLLLNQLKLIQRGLNEPEPDWQQLQIYGAAIKREGQQLRLELGQASSDCQQAQGWDAFDALDEATKTLDRAVVEGAVVVARGQFYQLFQRCG